MNVSNAEIKNSLIRIEEVLVEVSNLYNPILKVKSFNIFSDDFIIILGHNGSGKSTLLKILNGELKPNKGNVLFKGKSIEEVEYAHRAKVMLTLTQKVEDRLFSDLSIEENIAIWESRFPKSEQFNSKQLIEEFRLPKTFIQMLKNPIANLSGGEKQKLLIALMMAHPPQILFLDEHTSALDPKASEEIMIETDRAIIKDKITTVMITHSLEDAIKYGNRLVIINDGQIVFDQPKTRQYNKEELKTLMEGR